MKKTVENKLVGVEGMAAIRVGKVRVNVKKVREVCIVPDWSWGVARIIEAAILVLKARIALFVLRAVIKPF